MVIYLFSKLDIFESVLWFSSSQSAVSNLSLKQRGKRVLKVKATSVYAFVISSLYKMDT